MERIGKAFASRFVKDVAVVGMDGRESCPILKKAFIDGVLKSGKDVIDVGLVPRGVCLFWALKNKKPSAYLTASHLTKEWNGVKFAYDDAVEFFEDDNYRVRDAVLVGERKDAPRPGQVRKEEAMEAYKKFIASKIGPADKPLKVLIDCGNGTGGLVAPALFRELGFSVKTLFEEVDGAFPNRSSEITEETLTELKKRVSGFDLGIAYDGDSDRMALMDPLGRLLGPEVTSHIILTELANKEPGP